MNVLKKTYFKNSFSGSVSDDVRPNSTLIKTPCETLIPFSCLCHLRLSRNKTKECSYKIRQSQRPSSFVIIDVR